MKALVVIIVLLMLMGFGSWWLLKGEGPSKPIDINQDVLRAIKQAQEGAQNDGASIVIGPGGKTRSIQFSMEGAENVGTNISVHGEGPTAARITVTLARAEPLSLTQSAVDRIQPGMTFPQVADTLGGELKKGRLGDGFSGLFTIVQAQRSLELTFVDGKVTKATSKGVE